MKKYSILSIVSFVFVVIAILIWVNGLLLFLTREMMNSYLVLFWLEVNFVAILLGLVSLILSLISLKRFKKGLGKTGEKLSKITMYLAIGLILVQIIGIVILRIYKEFGNIV